MPAVDSPHDLALRPLAPWRPETGGFGNDNGSAPEQPCVLIVGDDAAACQKLSATLANEYAVELASDGRTAHACVQRRSIALVIVDIQHSGLHGSNLIYALRADARTRQLPVLVLAASEHRQILLQCLAGGANNFLLKPFGPDDLRACLRAELARAHPPG